MDVGDGVSLAFCYRALFVKVSRGIISPLFLFFRHSLPLSMYIHPICIFVYFLFTPIHTNKTLRSSRSKRSEPRKRTHTAYINISNPPSYYRFDFSLSIYLSFLSLSLSLRAVCHTQILLLIKKIKMKFLLRYRFGYRKLKR